MSNLFHKQVSPNLHLLFVLSIWLLIGWNVVKFATELKDGSPEPRHKTYPLCTATRTATYNSCTDEYYDLRYRQGQIDETLGQIRDDVDMCKRVANAGREACEHEMEN